MDVLLTGAFGRVGTAVIDGLADREAYDFTYLDEKAHPEYESIVADVTDYESIRPAFETADAVVHLAGYPTTDGTWSEILRNNVIGTYNVLEAAADAEVERFVFASTNHVVGMYELEHSPEIYAPDFDLTIDHTAPVRPDSYYGVSKLFGEGLGRYYVEHPEHDHPRRFYALRICGVRHAEYDHPYGDAERGVEDGRFERGSEAYDRAVARRKAMWTSRRDLAQFVDCCLSDDSVEFDVFYVVSDNDRRWFDLDHARDVLGYGPRDDAEEWDAPPHDESRSD
jgi:nucleoside-diphosphate-sugar epimerase